MNLIRSPGMSRSPANNTSSHDRNSCILTSAQNRDLNALPMMLSCLIIAAQLVNLLVFRRWRGKEPFLRLHVGLAVNSLLLWLHDYEATLWCVLYQMHTAGTRWTNRCCALRSPCGPCSRSATWSFWCSSAWTAGCRWSGAILYRRHVSKTRVVHCFWFIVGIALLIFLPGENSLSVCLSVCPLYVVRLIWVFPLSDSCHTCTALFFSTTTNHKLLVYNLLLSEVKLCFRQRRPYSATGSQWWPMFQDPGAHIWRLFSGPLEADPTVGLPASN